MHFFNPAQVMKLVEVVHTVSTSPDVTATVQDLCAKVGKVAVTCGDRSGFVVNALLFPYLNDAVRMLEANYASADDIDTAMKAGCGLPMGPFELLDVVGLDVSLAIERELLHRVPRARLRAGAAARAPGHRGVPRAQDRGAGSAPTPEPASGRRRVEATRTGVRVARLRVACTRQRAHRMRNVLRSRASAFAKRSSNTTRRPASWTSSAKISSTLQPSSPSSPLR